MEEEILELEESNDFINAIEKSEVGKSNFIIHIKTIDYKNAFNALFIQFIGNIKNKNYQ
jgi:hypothetical protein